MGAIEDQLKENRPNLSAGSIRTYASIIKSLGKALDVKIEKPSDVVSKHKAILKHFEAVPANVRKTRLAGLIVFLGKDKEAEDAVEAFRELMMADKKQSDEADKDQKMTEKQKEAWMPWQDVLEAYEVLKKEVTPLLKRNSLDKKQFARVQLFVLLSLLVLIPPRRSLDWTAFKLREVDKDTDNFLGTVKRKPVLVFNSYKTAGKTGQQTVEVPKALYLILKRWQELNPHEWLLMNYGQTGNISPTQLTQLLYGFFGRNVSTTMLRHIFLTERYKDVPALKEMEATAEAMGHSLNQAFVSYVKKQ